MSHSCPGWSLHSGVHLTGGFGGFSPGTHLPPSHVKPASQPGAVQIPVPGIIVVVGAIVVVGGGAFGLHALSLPALLHSKLSGVPTTSHG